MTDDARELLARMEAEEKAAQEKLDAIKAENAKKVEEIKAKLRADDLADVIAKCKLHGFTATDLRGALKTKGAGRKTAARKSPARKTAGRGKAKKAS